jgi:hypothetical protein
MSEPRWHDADPRPPYGGVPGPEIRSARKTPEPAPGGGRLRGSDRPAAWEGPGWYRDDSDPFGSVEMATGPRQADDLADDRRRGGRDDRVSGRPADRRRADPDVLPVSSWRWGELSGGRGTLIVVAAAILGAIVTVVTKRDPGSLLGWLVVAGTAIAGFAVRPRSAYLLVPVPALAYVVFGLAAGFIRHQSDPSSAGLAVNAAQWIANGFLIMAAATVLAVVIALGRWLLDRRASASPARRQRSGSGGRRGPAEPLDRADGDGARSVPSDSSGLIGQSDEVGFGGQRGWSGQSDGTGWGGRSGRGDASDWPGRGDGEGRSDRPGRSDRAGPSDRAGRPGRLDRAGGGADQGGRSGWDGRGDRSDRGRQVDRSRQVDRDRGEAPGRPKPAFYPNPDWPGGRGEARDPRDRRPPPGPPSFGASRDLGRRARARGVG